MWYHQETPLQLTPAPSALQDGRLLCSPGQEWYSACIHIQWRVFGSWISLMKVTLNKHSSTTQVRWQGSILHRKAKRVCAWSGLVSSGSLCLRGSEAVLSPAVPCCLKAREHCGGTDSQLQEGTALPAEWLGRPCHWQSWLSAMMIVVVLPGPKWVWDKLGTADFFKPAWPNAGEDAVCSTKLCLCWMRGLLTQHALASKTFPPAPVVSSQHSLPVVCAAAPKLLSEPWLA